MLLGYAFFHPIFFKFIYEGDMVAVLQVGEGDECGGGSSDRHASEVGRRSPAYGRHSGRSTPQPGRVQRR